MMRNPGPQADQNNGFLFLGNQLTLDFVNTCPVQDGQPVELLPDFEALLGWFQAAGLLRSREADALGHNWAETERGRKITEAMRELREKWRKQVLALERGGKLQSATLKELNELMAAHPMRTRIMVKRNSYSRELWFRASEPEDLFAPLAHSAADLFATVDRRRLRKCARCVLHFVDTSKKGTRRWCSMQLCGNRLKVSAYAARQRIKRAKAI